MFDVGEFMSTFETGKVNGFDLMIMQSDEYTDTILKLFEKAIKNGCDPNQCQFEIYRAAGVNDFDNDIIDEDKERIKVEVEKMYRRYNSRY